MKVIAVEDTSANCHRATEANGCFQRRTSTENRRVDTMALFEKAGSFAPIMQNLYGCNGLHCFVFGSRIWYAIFL